MASGYSVPQPSTSPSEIVSDVVEQKNESLRWANQNYYGELSEIYRSAKARVLPVMNERTNKEIKNRTNVALPDHFVMIRRGTARLTVNPPNLRVRGGTSQAQRDALAALNYFQWDRSQEQRVLRQVVHQCKMFGWSCEKTYWDTVKVEKLFWRWTKDLSRGEVMRQQGAPQDEIDDAGDLPMDPNEMAAAIADLGDKVQVNTPTLKYDGPVGARIFIGDMFLEPGFRSMNQSSYVIEYSERDIRWLKYWAKQQTTNPYTGEEQPVMDQVQCQDLIDRGGRSLTYQRDMDLRRQLRLAINQSDPRTNFDPRLRGPRYSILERHSRDDSGYIVVDFIGDESVHLGRMWYPWKTYGKYLYTEMVLIPDILGGIGDSTPRISRFLMQMRNTRMNQTTDFINNVLRPTYTKLDTADITDESFIRTGWGNIVEVQSHDDLRERQQFNLPPEAFQDQAQLVREMQQIDGTTADFLPGTESTPQAGRLATTAVLQQRSTDTITGDELAQIDLFLTDLLDLRMSMNQQTLDEVVKIPKGYDHRIDALSERLATDQGGDVTLISVDPMDLQDDLQIIPETGSTLAADDQFKRAAIERGYQIAMGNPAVFNVRKFAEKLAQTIPGMTAEEALVPENPNPPTPEIKMSMSMQIKFDELSTDVQVALLSKMGLPTQGTQTKGALDAVQHLSDAADAASNLQQPDHETLPPSSEKILAGNGNGNGASH